MNREKALTYTLGGFIGLAVLCMLAFFLIWMPLSELNTQADALSLKNTENEAKLAKIRKELPRLQTAMKRSLPADAGAAQEYDAVINRLLRDAKVPAGSFSVKPKSVDGKATPEIGLKKPAFNRIGLEITLKKVKFGTLLEVLYEYYNLNLLHQITRFTMKKVDDKEPPAPRGSPVADKSDLDVTIVTEAIILDGAEPRRSLFTVPAAFGTVGGAAGLQLLAYSPEPARGLTPVQLAEVLSSNDRDYTLLLVKDLFHGPPPPPAPPPAVPPPPAPKEDTSEFIRITALGQNADGSGSAVIEDLASKQEYLVDVRWDKNQKLVPSVTKYYYTIKGLRKSYEPEPMLDISEASSSTARKFRIVCLLPEGILLGETSSSGAPAAPKAPTAPGGFGGGPPRTTRGGNSTKIPPLAIVGGGLAWSVGPGPEKFYLWKPGQPLATIKEATGEMIDKAQRLTAGASSEKTEAASK